MFSRRFLLQTIYGYGELIFRDFIDNKSQSKEHICLSDIATFYNGYSYSGEELCEQNEEALVTIKNFDRNGGFKAEGFKPIRITGKIKPSMYVELGDLLVAHTDLTQNADIIGNPIILINLGQYKKAAISMDLVKIVIIFDKNSAIVPACSGVYRVRNREFKNVTHNCFPAYAEFKCEIVHLFVTTFANNL